MKKPPESGSMQGRRYDEYHDENAEVLSPFLARYLTIVLVALACWGICALVSV